MFVFGAIVPICYAGRRQEVHVLSRNLLDCLRDDKLPSGLEGDGHQAQPAAALLRAEVVAIARLDDMVED
jgi:hypothetical protein